MRNITLITGAASGMGRKTALLLAGKGYEVFAGVRKDEDGRALREEAKAAGSVLNTVTLDVTDTKSVDAAVKEIVQKAGRIDNLVNNAGFGVLATVEEATDEEMIKQFDVNVFGVLRMCRAVLPLMRAENHGVIVNISSFLGRMGLPLLTHYNASKYAVEAITDSLRYEAGNFGIRVHSVMPGLFGTNFVKKGLVANGRTTSGDSPYAKLVSHMAPIVAEKINNGPDPIAVAEAVAKVIEDATSPIRVPVGIEATTFVPMVKEMNEEAFEAKVKATFGI